MSVETMIRIHRTRLSVMRVLAKVTAILVANSVLVTLAAGQAAFTELPQNCSDYASIPLPAEAEKIVAPKSAPSCASYRSYRGIGRPVNYSQARSCAWQERLAQKADLAQNQEEPIAWVVGCSLILADIYFNGSGVKRNTPLAMRFACEFEEGAAMLALPEIAKLKESPPANRLFEFCDYAASTFTMNFCSGYKSEIEDEHRNRFYKTLEVSLTMEQQAAFEKLLAAQNAYIEAHASEVYQGGTIRTMRTIGSESILKNLFRNELAHFERKKWPTLSENQVQTADVLLQREFEKAFHRLQTLSKEEREEGGVTTKSLSQVERTWEAYRDAWVSFARLRYPDAVPAIRAEITLERYRLLKTIP